MSRVDLRGVKGVSASEGKSPRSRLSDVNNLDFPVLEGEAFDNPALLPFNHDHFFPSISRFCRWFQPSRPPQASLHARPELPDSQHL